MSVDSSRDLTMPGKSDFRFTETFAVNVAPGRYYLAASLLRCQSIRAEKLDVEVVKGTPILDQRK